jgi:hypothetical protein
MDNITAYYRIDTILVGERELAHRLEQARIVAERRAQKSRPLTLTTGSLATIPAAAH